MDTLEKVDLVQIAAEINAEHDKAVATARSALQHAIKAGDLLIQAQRELKHGEWIDWVEANCTFTYRMANNYVRLARNKTWLESETVSDLTVRGALDRVRYHTNFLKLEERLIEGSADASQNVRAYGDDISRETHRKREQAKEYNRIVHDYLKATSTMSEWVDKAVVAVQVGRFSPEAKGFVTRRHNKLRAKLDELDQVLREVGQD